MVVPRDRQPRRQLQDPLLPAVSPSDRRPEYAVAPSVPLGELLHVQHMATELVITTVSRINGSGGPPGATVAHASFASQSLVRFFLRSSGARHVRSSPIRH